MLLNSAIVGAEPTLVLFVLAPLLLGVIAYRTPLPISKIIIILTQVAAIAWSGYLLSQTLRYGSLIQTLGGADRALYIELAANPVSLGLTLLTAVLMLAATLCGLNYTKAKLVLLYGILQGLISGIFLTDDIFNLFVLLEVLTIVMVLLNVYRKEVRSVYDALYYLIIQIIGMTFFLLGLAYVYRATGQLSMTLIAQTVDAGLVTPSALVLPFVLMLAGLGLKIGLFPLYSYVPRFYGNPGAPLSVLMLSSSLLATAALFWIARITWTFWPLHAAPLLLVLGCVTAVAGALKALAQSDARLVLAFSTVSQAGLALIALGSDNAVATRGFVLHLFAHAVAKALLFLVVGALAERIGTTEVTAISREVWRRPLTAVAMVVGAISLIGIPLTAGGFSKYWIMYGAAGWVELATWVVTLGTTLVMLRLLLPSAPVILRERPWRVDAGSQLGLDRGSASTALPRLAQNDDLAIPAGGDEPVILRERPWRVDAGSRRPAVAGVLAALTALVIGGGLLGSRGFGELIGSYNVASWGISTSSLLVKAVQLLGVIVVALVLTWWLPKRLWWRSAPPTSVRSALAGSLALPDAVLALVVFFVVMLLLAFVPGVM